MVLILPCDESLHQTRGETRAFSLQEVKAIVTVSAVKQGALDQFFPVGQPPADPADVERLRSRVSNREVTNV
jgi:hypothetical protein